MGSFSPMRPTILVTGATGALGRHLIGELRSSGYQVRCQYRTRSGTVEGPNWQGMDFLESLDFSALVAGCDAVIHLAAETNHGPVMHRVNVEATAALLAAAQSAGARYFGYASSIVVYGSPPRRMVDEVTPLLDLRAPLIRQYHADPSMLEYARTKVLAERTIDEFRPNMTVDIYRPSVVVDLNRVLEAGNWSTVRKLIFAYRQTQYIYVLDVTAAISYLLAKALGSPKVRSRIEAFNLCDEDCGTFREILTVAHEATGDPRYRVSASLPMAIVLDLAKDMVKFRDPGLRYSLGMLKFRNVKLLGTGFTLPHGIKSALSRALAGARPG
jgi:nucleoside-diphosphate-sugar epimerase